MACRACEETRRVIASVWRRINVRRQQKTRPPVPTRAKPTTVNVRPRRWPPR
jgi:hypothetical protein